MISGILTIIGVYALCALIVHVSHYFHLKKKGEIGLHKVHYVIISYQNEKLIEWVLRSIFFFFWLHGKEVKITVVDKGSTDDTLAITSRMILHKDLQIKSYQMIEEYQTGKKIFDENVTVIDLTKDIRLQNIPLL
ncbi:hypothetical protein [Chengkuizengella axinellae]|uniref:Glycosyltransferase n=1 Tax=Chengkuizengella axinellae TaxID=3064388 RepID=A0ABT9J2M6_9BACL|nr:hypothetical protein [Chengkuizengella sp. 2205SS18-9]MDP5275871.1 hypothetical protein [Chengkuizengella sp. 2205SS18-9]